MLRRSNLNMRLALGAEPPIWAKRILTHFPATRGISQPNALSRRIETAGSIALHQIAAKRRVALDPGLDPLQPLIPPTLGLLKKADPWLRRSDMWIEMHPRPTDPFRAFDVFNQSRDRVLIAVRPASDGQNLGLNAAKVLTDRAMHPETVAPLMLKPVGNQKWLAL